MITVIIAQFTDAQEATNFLLRSIDPNGGSPLGDFIDPNELPPPLSNIGMSSPQQVNMQQLLEQQRAQATHLMRHVMQQGTQRTAYPFGVSRTAFAPTPAAINAPDFAAHAMQAMSGADQDRVAENAALDGESVVPPAVTVPPPNAATDLNDLPRVPQTPPNPVIDPNSF